MMKIKELRALPVGALVEEWDNDPTSWRWRYVVVAGDHNSLVLRHTHQEGGKRNYLLDFWQIKSWNARRIA